MNNVRISESEFDFRWTGKDKAAFNRGYIKFWRNRGMSVPGDFRTTIDGAAKGGAQKRKAKA